MTTFLINIFLWVDCWFIVDHLFVITHTTSFISYRLLPFLFTPSTWFFHFLFVYLVFFLFIMAFVLCLTKCLRDR